MKEIPTKTLRNTQSYVTQETELFHDSIANNIAIGKPGAAREEIIKAAQKASIHDMIMSLPNGYDTEVGELETPCLVEKNKESESPEPSYTTARCYY